MGADGERQGGLAASGRVKRGVRRKMNVFPLFPRYVHVANGRVCPPVPQRGRMTLLCWD